MIGKSKILVTKTFCCNDEFIIKSFDAPKSVEDVTFDEFFCKKCSKLIFNVFCDIKDELCIGFFIECFLPKNIIVYICCSDNFFSYEIFEDNLNKNKIYSAGNTFVSEINDEFFDKIFKIIELKVFI